MNMKKVSQGIILFVFGGLVYGVIELLWRGHTHWTMILTGGLCFYLLYVIYNRYPYTPLYVKCVTGAAVITAVEFLVGYVVNIIFKMNVWDYSSRPLNIMGQVCLHYSVLWGVLSIPIYYVSRYIGENIFNRYTWEK